MGKEQLVERLQQMAEERNPFTIRIKDLAEEMGMDPTEVRNTIRQLEQEGGFHTKRRGPLGIDVFVGQLPAEEESPSRRRKARVGEEVYCVYCGQKVRTDWNYCMHCGERIIKGL